MLFRCLLHFSVFFFFFFNDTAPTEIYTLSLHDALPIYGTSWRVVPTATLSAPISEIRGFAPVAAESRSEEHTSELQSRGHLVCRLLLEKKKKKNQLITNKRYTNKQ